MPKITKITAQSSRADRVNIFADGKFLTGLDRFTWLQLGLKTGNELTSKMIERLKNEDTAGKCYDKALKLLSFRPQSRCELKQKLSKRFAPETIQQVLARLAKDGLINDEKFAAIWVNERLLTRHRSLQHLMAELRQKGIERRIIQTTISRIDKQLEIDAALGLAQRYINKPPEKLRAVLARRGFSYPVIREVEKKLQAQAQE
jgi:regulatory protein